MIQDIYSLGGRASVSLWTVKRISAALLPRCLSNFGAIGSVLTRISQLREFTRSCGDHRQESCLLYISNKRHQQARARLRGQLELRWVPTKKFGEIKRICVWFHSHKVCWVNPAQFCSYKASNVIGCYPKVCLKTMFYFYSSFLKWHLKKSKILSTENNPLRMIKQLCNAYSSPFYLYGDNFIHPQLTAIALCSKYKPL